jgi:hypothetical protein
MFDSDFFFVMWREVFISWVLGGGKGVRVKQFPCNLRNATLLPNTVSQLHLIIHLETRIKLGDASDLMAVLVSLTGQTQPYEWY